MVVEPEVARSSCFLMPKDYIVTGKPMLVSTVLGSCVAACLHDAEAGVAGPGRIRGEKLRSLNGDYLTGDRDRRCRLRSAAGPGAGMALVWRAAECQQHQRGDEAGERS